MKNYHFSQKITIFHGRPTPEEGTVVGYAAIIDALELPVPIPQVITLISNKNRNYNQVGWIVLSSRYLPEDTLYKQLVFALKYEGINLLVFKYLFKKIDAEQVKQLIKIEPTGQYSRRIWFLYEWLMGGLLDVPDIKAKKYESLVDEKQQFAVNGIPSSRHRIINNLPGTPDFCPLISKTPKLLKFIDVDLSKGLLIKSFHKDILQRASAFLLLKDSKASFNIEGENPGSNRALRWGKAIAQAGQKQLSIAELERLQQIVIESKRFTKLGIRKQAGFVGEHDRVTGEPIPDHISAKWQDLNQLLQGLISTYKHLESSNFNAVLSAAVIAFGFVFIHPFVDGNGRIHRYLIHHILTKASFYPQGVVFPISASILNHIGDYRKVLESYSHQILDFVEWETTADNNVEVLNDTIDYYRYYDATLQAEFMCESVLDTIGNIIPEEIEYLRRYDDFKRYLDDNFEMPDKLVATLVRFLNQDDGRLSNRAKKQIFKELSNTEIEQIESSFRQIFLPIH